MKEKRILVFDEDEQRLWWQTFESIEAAKKQIGELTKNDSYFLLELKEVLRGEK